MKTKINLDWITNLHEIGSPLTDRREKIICQIEEEDKRLRDAKKFYAARMSEIRRSAEVLEQEVTTLWTPEEITAAKRGVMLIDGMEYP